MVFIAFFFGWLIWGFC